MPRSITLTVVLLDSLLLVGCSALPRSPDPAIVFTKVPPFGEGSSNKLDIIEGRAPGARAGDHIVLYAHAGVWWIQPFTEAPFTEVQPDSVWKSKTHPGTEYAALLVGSDYHPPLKIDALPGKGGAIIAVATVQSPPLPKPARRTLLFAGYEWQIRQTDYDPGGSPNRYNPDNAWIDAHGMLHLRIAGSPGRWTSAEVKLLRHLGYGSYRFVVRNLSALEPSAAFTMVTWDDDGPPREMDIEISKWGEPQARAGQFVIQPYDIPANTVQFDVPPGIATFMLRWSPGRAAFRAFHGATSHWDATPVRDHVFTSGVPSPGNESVHMNLYVFDQIRNPLQHESEVVVEAFDYLP